MGVSRALLLLCSGREFRESPLYVAECLSPKTIPDKIWIPISYHEVWHICPGLKIIAVLYSVVMDAELLLQALRMCTIMLSWVLVEGSEQRATLYMPLSHMGQKGSLTLYFMLSDVTKEITYGCVLINRERQCWTADF